MLGHKLVQVLGERFEVWMTIRGEFSGFETLQIFDFEKTFHGMDAQNFEDFTLVLERLRPEVVINAVGVIKQVETSKDVVKTLNINSIFPHRLAHACKELDARLITFSTDCVFSGKKGNYSEEDLPDALDLYGRSKILGEVAEENCLTLRTSIIGREIESSNGLLEWFISNRGGSVKGFKNAVFSGFPTVVLAGIIGDLIENHPGLQGIYHLSSHPISKYDLLNLCNEKLKLGIEIEPEEEFRIDRSLDSERFRKATGFSPCSWEEMIESMAEDAILYENWRAA